MRQFEDTALEYRATASHADQSRSAARWRTIGYGVAIGAFLFMVAFAWLRPDFNRTEIPDWRPVLALADEAWEKGDLSAARHFYLQVDQIASSEQDWEGLVQPPVASKGWMVRKGPIPRLLRSWFAP